VPILITLKVSAGAIAHDTNCHAYSCNIFYLCPGKPAGVFHVVECLLHNFRAALDTTLYQRLQVTFVYSSFPIPHNAGADLTLQAENCGEGPRKALAASLIGQMCSPKAW
jgi:hypothetical protein